MKKLAKRPAPAATVLFNMNMDAKLHRRLRMLAADRGVAMAVIVIDALKAKGIK